jgi:hypothetical protein
MTHPQPPPGSKAVWAYAYEIVPPQPEERLRRILALLDREQAHARLGDRIWEARFVHGQQVTHILVVSDNPQQDLEVNRRLEAELQGLEAGFSITAPLEVADEPVPPPLVLV